MTGVEGWRIGLVRRGLRVGTPCSEKAFDAARALGVALPADLRRLYLVADGIFDESGQWWAVWPLDQVVRNNVDLRAAGLISPDRVAFGDDGTGEPFSVVSDGPVERWSLIGGDVESTWNSVAEFLDDWFEGLLLP